MHAFSNLPLTYDVLVVGAGPAGAASAMLLARAGARVLLIDRNLPEAATHTAELLSVDAVVQLSNWGLLQRIDSVTPPVRRLVVQFEDRAPKVTQTAAALYAPRSSLLNRTLVDAAIAAGAVARFIAEPIALLRDDNGRVTGARLDIGEEWTVPIHADLVIGADGARSTVAYLANAKTTWREGPAMAQVVGLFHSTWHDLCHWHFDNGVLARMCPTNDGLTSVVASMTEHTFETRFRHRLEAGLRETLASLASGPPDCAAAGGHIIGVHGWKWHKRTPDGSGWALVGDARQYRESNGSSGIAAAFQDALQICRDILGGFRGVSLKPQPATDYEGSAWWRGTACGDRRSGDGAPG